MAEEKLGVENLKKVLAAVVNLTNKIDSVTQDGFQFLGDSIALVPNLLDLVVIVQSGKDALAEFKDLDEAEKAEVIAYVKGKFDIEDDKLEDVIETALDTLSKVAELVVKVRVALKK